MNIALLAWSLQCYIESTRGMLPHCRTLGKILPMRADAIDQASTHQLAGDNPAQLQIPLLQLRSSKLSHLAGSAFPYIILSLACESRVISVPEQQIHVDRDILPGEIAAPGKGGTPRAQSSRLASTLDARIV